MRQLFLPRLRLLMQPRPQKKTRMAERLDRLGLSALVFAACAVFFLFLWGAFLPALAAGISLSSLALVPLLRLCEKRRARKSEQTAKRLAAEKKVRALLFARPEDAAFQASQWVSAAYALRDITKENGGFCTAFHEEKKAAIFFLQKHPCATIGCNELLPCVRAAMQCGAEICAICAPCKFVEDAEQNIRHIVANQPAVLLFGEKPTVGFCEAFLTNEEIASYKAHSSPSFSQSNKKRLWHEWRAKALRRKKCPRYAFLALASALGFRQGGHPLSLLCAAICVLLLFLSLFSPFARKRSDFFQENP